MDINALLNDDSDTETITLKSVSQQDRGAGPSGTQAEADVERPALTVQTLAPGTVRLSPRISLSCRV